MKFIKNISMCILFITLSAPIAQAADHSLEHNGVWWQKLSEDQRSSWAEAYLAGVKDGVMAASIYHQPQIYEESWWSATDYLEKRYRYLTPALLVDELNKIYRDVGVRIIPVKQAVQEIDSIQMLPFKIN